MADEHSHYFDGAPTAAARPRTVTLALADATFELRTDASVFSAARIDPGTAVLLGAAPEPPVGGELLDLGCGYGPIAVALAHRAPGARVWAIDVNPRARELARANADALGLTNVCVHAPDELPAELRFAAIYSNPPIRIGKPALHALLVRWLDRLEPDGRAVLVVQRHLGGDSLARWLEQRGHRTRRLASKRGYRVLEACSAV